VLVLQRISEVTSDQAEFFVHELRGALQLFGSQEHSEFGLGEPLELQGIQGHDDATGIAVPSPTGAYAGGRHDDLEPPIDEVPELTVAPILHAHRLVLEVDEHMMLLELGLLHHSGSRLEVLQRQKPPSRRSRESLAVQERWLGIDVPIPHATAPCSASGFFKRCMRMLQAPLRRRDEVRFRNRSSTAETHND